MQQRVGEVVEENVDVRKSARKTVVVVGGGDGEGAQVKTYF